MRATLLCLLLAACAGPSQGALANTPTATTPRPLGEAPPASVDDKDRDQSIQQFDDMHDAQQARHEASQSSAAPPPGSGSAAVPTVPGPNPPVKHGPAVQAPDPKQAPSK